MSLTALLPWHTKPSGKNKLEFEQPSRPRMNDKHRQVREWLSTLFVDGKQQQYEIGERPLEILDLLKCRCDQREKDTRHIIEDLKRKTEEYRVEAFRLRGILNQLGLLPSSLSQSGAVSLRTLSNLALQLDIRNTSETSYLLGMRKLSKSVMDVVGRRRAEQRANTLLLSRTKCAINKMNSLRKALQASDEQASYQNPEIEQRAKQASFLQSKSREYRHQIQHHQAQLEKTGLNPQIRHEALCHRYEELQALGQRLIPLKSKLNSYHDLPPDLSLAKLKIEETRQHLAALERELSKHIDMMHM